MRSIGNFIWFFVLGWWQWLIYMFLAFVFGLTVIFLPIAKSMREIAKLLIMPFGKDIIRKKNQGTYDRSFGLLFNIVWFPIGIISSIIFFIIGILSFITIIGIPIGFVYLKLAKLIIMPIGIKVVTKKEHIQELVKEELIKQGKNNKEISIDKKVKLYDEIVEGKTNISLKTGNTDVSLAEATKPFWVLKPIIGLFVLFFQFIFILIPLLNFIKELDRFNGMFHTYKEDIIVFIGFLFLLLSVIQLLIYLFSKINIKKYLKDYINKNKILKILSDLDFDIIFVLFTGLIILIVNILLIILILFLLFKGQLGIGISLLFSFNLGMFYQYIFIAIYLKKVGGIKKIKKYLIKYENNKVIKLLIKGLNIFKNK